MTTDTSLPILAATMRASNALLVDMLSDAAFAADPVGRLIGAALFQADIEGVVTNERPRPCTISAVAAAAGIPFETARRRILAMVAAGLCELKPEGGRVPSLVIDRPENARTMALFYELSRTLHQRLTDNLCLPELSGEPGIATAAPPVPIVARLACDHLLRMVSALVKAVGDLQTVLFFVAILRENAEHTAVLPATLVSDGLMPDSQKIPVSSTVIGKLLGLGKSTVKRRIAELVSQGLCQWRKGGVIVSVDVVRRPEILQIMAYNYESIGLLFGALHRLGVLARWNAEAVSSVVMTPGLSQDRASASETWRSVIGRSDG